MLKKMYLLLFNRVTDALDAIERGDLAQARTLPVSAQQQCEELYMEGTEDE